MKHGNICLQKEISGNVYNGHKQEIYKSTNIRVDKMDKQVVYMLHWKTGKKKGWTTHIYNNMDESQKKKSNI